MKRNEGITLIALIITIIILIILTAITINSITSTNLFGLARGAAENYIQAGKDEEKAIDDMISKVQEIEKGLGSGGTVETEDEDLSRYILGEGKTGRDLSEISNILQAMSNIRTLQFQPDADMETDISSSVSALATGNAAVYDEDNPIGYIYIKYKNEAYRITIKMVVEGNGGKVLSTALKKVYEPTGREGQKVEYSYDGTDTHKKDWTIIKDNQDGTVDIVSPETLDTLTLGENDFTSSEKESEQVNKTIEDYNDAINKINQKCQEVVKNKDNNNVIKVRSVGAETDDSGLYTSDRITRWAQEHTYLSKYNGKGKTGDTYYEDDLVRMSYHGVQSTRSEYWLASRYVYDNSSDVNFNVIFVNEDGLLSINNLWYVGSNGNVNSYARGRGVRPVVTIKYPIAEN